MTTLQLWTKGCLEWARFSAYWCGFYNCRKLNRWVTRSRWLEESLPSAPMRDVLHYKAAGPVVGRNMTVSDSFTLMTTMNAHDGLRCLIISELRERPSRGTIPVDAISTYVGSDGILPRKSNDARAIKCTSCLSGYSTSTDVKNERAFLSSWSRRHFGGVIYHKGIAAASTIEFKGMGKRLGGTTTLQTLDCAANNVFCRFDVTLRASCMRAVLFYFTLFFTN